MYSNKKTALAVLMIASTVVGTMATSCSNKIASFTLVDADLNTDIMTLGNYFIEDVPAMLSIRANPNACDGPKSVDSVLVTFDNPAISFCEINTPYTLFRDPSSEDLMNDKADYLGKEIPLGTHKVTATPYTSPDCSYGAGTPLVKTFTVTKKPPCQNKLSDFTLVDAETDKDIMPLGDYNIHDLPHQEVSIRANPKACAGPKKVDSVLITFDNPAVSFCEINTPYTSFRDPSTDDLANNMANYLGKVIPAGTHTITATPYTSPDCTTGAGPKVVKTFIVSDCDTEISGFTLVNADTEADIMALGSFSYKAGLLSIRADPKACTGLKKIDSVLVTFDNPAISFCEIHTPYTVFRDPSSTDLANNMADYRGVVIPIGTHTVTATPYASKDCSGGAGPTFTQIFDVMPPPTGGRSRQLRSKA
jgi:hypothetical protein